MKLRSLVLPWSTLAILFVLSIVLGAGITLLTRGTWGSFLDPLFLLEFAVGWFGAALAIRWIARRSPGPTSP